LADQSFVFPLYLYPENTSQKLLETPVRTPNLNPGILQQIAEKLGLIFIPEKPGRGALPASLNTANIQEHNNPYAPADNQTFAPIDLLDYIYAVLHSPDYRETYKEFLKIDFPRVPYPEPQTFWPLVKLGAELRQLHLLGGEGSIPSAALPTSMWVESPVLDNLITTYPKDGDNIVTRKINKNDFEIAGAVDKSGISRDLVSVHLPLCKRGIEGDLSNKISPNPSFPKRGTERLRDLQETIDGDLSAPSTDADNAGNSASTGRVWINDRQYFDGVPVVAWEFYIGGYQPAQKWLKDRHGRKLNFEDIRHYQKIIVALTETHRIMQTIDSIWHSEN